MTSDKIIIPTSRTGIKRASKPKVKSGCKTCKLRRVKCDETKPACRRCLRYWGSCDGYPPDPTEQKDALVTTKSTTSEKPFLLLQPRTGPRFENGEDHRYFQIFCDYTAVTLGGSIDSFIWSNLMPQACEREPFVRDALVAVGALTKTLHDVQRIRQMGIAPAEGELCLGMSADHEQALKRYARAIKGMQKASLNGGKGIRTALIACLLVVCFEGLYASHVQALTHAQSGIKLLQHWIKENSSTNTSSLRSPAPDIVEDELIFAFNRLDLQVLTYFDTRPVALHQSFKNDASTALKSMPTVFLSLRQARSFFDLIMRRLYHFLATVSYAGKADEMEAIGCSIKSEGAADLPGGINSFSHSKTVPQWLVPERDLHAAELSRWTTAFEPLFKTLESPSQTCSPRNQGSLGAKILKLHATKAKIMLAGAFFTHEISYDVFLSDFQHIYHLAASVYPSLIAAHADQVSYHFDPSVLPALFLLVTRCRDRVLRRKVIRLLTTSFHREGPWDSLAIARMGEWIMGVEEEGVRTEVVPDWRRARMTRFHVDAQRRQIQCRCYQRVEEGDEDVMWKNVVLTW